MDRHKNTKHGMFGTPTYGIWAGMKSRCNNPKRSIYKYYGGRGIKVCERWDKFENFFEDMGVRPEGLSLERINNDGNYEPGNCKWATRQEQIQNRRSQKRLCYNCRMEIEPIPANEHLVGIYSKLPEATLAAEEIRIRGVVSDMAGKLIAITQAKETNNEHTISA